MSVKGAYKLRCRVCSATVRSFKCDGCGNFICPSCSYPRCKFCRNWEEDNRRYKEKERARELAFQAPPALGEVSLPVAADEKTPAPVSESIAMPVDSYASEPIAMPVGTLASEPIAIPVGTLASELEALIPRIVQLEAESANLRAELDRVNHALTGALAERDERPKQEDMDEREERIEALEKDRTENEEIIKELENWKEEREELDLGACGAVYSLVRWVHELGASLADVNNVLFECGAPGEAFDVARSAYCDAAPSAPNETFAWQPKLPAPRGD